MIREATADDRDLVHALWCELEAEVPDLPWCEDDEDPDGSDRAAAAGVEAVESNDAARTLYDRLGFRTVERQLSLRIGAASNTEKALRSEPPVRLGSGWVRVDTEPDKLRTPARELSFTSGVALGANATALARLTGADPARVRQVARTASSPSELPPAGEPYRQICELLGVEC